MSHQCFSSGCEERNDHEKNANSSFSSQKLNKIGVSSQPLPCLGRAHQRKRLQEVIYFGRLMPGTNSYIKNPSTYPLRELSVRENHYCLSVGLLLLNLPRLHI